MKIRQLRIQKLKQKTSLKVFLLAFTFSVFIITAGILIFLAGSNPKEVIAAASNDSGSCVTFNGTTSYIDYGSIDFGLSSSNTMTLSAWVKWNSKTGIPSWANIAALNNSTANGDVGQFWLQHDYTNNFFEFAVQTTSSRQYVLATNASVTGVWYFVTGVYDGSSIKMYVNGKLQATVSQTGNISAFNSSYKFMIGKWANVGRYFNGDIDEVSIWKIALSQNQIRNMMCKKLAGNETGLVGYWRMNEATGTTVYDNTSFGHSGIITNATRIYSGAPVGDTAVYVYASGQLTFANFRGDSLKVNNFSSTPSGIYIYRVDTCPNSTTYPAGFTNFGVNYFYGVFIPDYNNETYNLTYYYLGYPGINDKSQLGMAYRNANNDLNWSDLLATIDTVNNRLMKNGISNRHEFMLSSKTTINPLPIELMNFTVRANGKTVQFSWQTASEINNDYFTIERSTDGQHFENIESIRGAGNSTVVHSYATTDVDPPLGSVYYRLKQTDYDGKYKEFKIESVTIGTSNDDYISMESASPNPFSHRIHVSFQTNQKIVLSIALFSSSGVQVYSNSIVSETGINETEISAGDNIPDGIYYLVILDSKGHRKQIKLLKS